MAGEVRPRSHQETERRGTIVSDPARKERAERRDIGIERIEPPLPEVTLGVVERHEDDDEPAENVDRIQTRPRSRRGGSKVFDRRGWLDALRGRHVDFPFDTNDDIGPQVLGNRKAVSEHSDTIAFGG